MRAVARAGGGATWRAFDAATQAHGLAAPGGTFGTTGVGGLTLGGGIGFLIGRYGLSCDNLVGAEVVTVDGTVVEASDDAHADLFWAIRGGGGNFGVVTRLDFRLHPVDEVVGGILLWPIHAAAEPMRVFRDVALAAPDDFSTQAVLGHSAQNGAVRLRRHRLLDRAGGGARAAAPAPRSRRPRARRGSPPAVPGAAEPARHAVRAAPLLEGPLRA